MRSLFLILTASSLLAACTFEGLRSPGPSHEYAWTNRNKATPAEVLPELERCGGGSRQVLNVKAGESTTDAKVRIDECMFAKGFYIKGGYGGYCSNPFYRTTVPACQNVPIRSRNNYYGQTPSEREQRRLDQDMANAIKRYKAEEALYVNLDFGTGGVDFRNPAKLSNERTMQDANDCNAYQRAVKFSDPGLLQKEKYQSVECMLKKGYVLSEPETQRLCRNVDFKNTLSSCLGVRK